MYKMYVLLSNLFSYTCMYFQVSYTNYDYNLAMEAMVSARFWNMSLLYI